MDVSIIIVSYNTRDILKNCIDSIVKHTTDVEYEIIVSDNGSTDGSIEYLKEVQAEINNLVIIENGMNLGFGAANNRALPVARGKYIFYLNSDTILLNNAVWHFYQFWEENSNLLKIGALGAQLENTEGEIIQSWGRYPTPIGVFKALIHMILVAIFGLRVTAGNVGNRKDNYYVANGYITGADLFVLNNDGAKFDEQFFMYAEEADLEYNSFVKQGKQCLVIPEPRIIHLEGASDKSVPHKNKYSFVKKSTAMLWVSNLKYIKKNCGGKTWQYNICKFILKIIWKVKGKAGREYLGWLCELE